MLKLEHHLKKGSVHLDYLMDKSGLSEVEKAEMIQELQPFELNYLKKAEQKSVGRTKIIIGMILLIFGFFAIFYSIWAIGAIVVGLYYFVTGNNTFSASNED